MLQLSYNEIKDQYKTNQGAVINSSDHRLLNEEEKHHGGVYGIFLNKSKIKNLIISHRMVQKMLDPDYKPHNSESDLSWDKTRVERFFDKVLYIGKTQDFHERKVNHFKASQPTLLKMGKYFGLSSYDMGQFIEFRILYSAGNVKELKRTRYRNNLENKMGIIEENYINLFKPSFNCPYYNHLVKIK